MLPACGDYVATSGPDGACGTARRTGATVGSAAEDDAVYSLYLLPAVILSGAGVA